MRKKHQQNGHLKIRNVYVVAILKQKNSNQSEKNLKTTSASNIAIGKKQRYPPTISISVRFKIHRVPPGGCCWMAVLQLAVDPHEKKHDPI